MNYRYDRDHEFGGIAARVVAVTNDNIRYPADEAPTDFMERRLLRLLEINQHAWASPEIFGTDATGALHEQIRQCLVALGWQPDRSGAE